MELVIFGSGVVVVLLYMVWRARTGGTSDPTLDHDERERIYGDSRPIVRSHVFGIRSKYADFRVPRVARVPRESGHGKDGGG